MSVTARRALAEIAWRAHPGGREGVYRVLRQSQWLPAAELERLQLAALNDVLAAARSIPFYRGRLEAAGIGSGGVRSLAELSGLAPLERAAAQRLGVAGLRRGRALVIRRSTTGSTGEPVEVAWPLEMMAWVDAVERRSQEWLGVALGERKLYVRTRRPRLGVVRRAHNLLRNHDTVGASALRQPKALEDFVRRIVSDPPALVAGNTNYLYLLARNLEGRTIPAKAVVASGSRLEPHYRKAIERAFACPVYERYGTLETGLLAHPCREGRRQHVPAEAILLEVVRDDGAPADPGETGHVLVTCLRNRAMPLIRYRIGDLAALGSGPCACGRALPHVERIVGRSNDLLVTVEGDVLPPEFVIARVMEAVEESVRELRIVQQPDLRLDVLVVQRDEPDPDRFRRRVADVLERLIGRRGVATVARVGEMPLGPGGKLRTIMSHAEASTSLGPWRRATPSSSIPTSFT